VLRAGPGPATGGGPVGAVLSPSGGGPRHRCPVVLLDGRLPAIAGAGLLATAAGVVLVCAALAVPVRATSRIAPVRVLAEE